MLTETTLQQLDAWLKSSQAGPDSFQALEEFKKQGFPTNRLEEWKYASLKSLNEQDWMINPSLNPKAVHFFSDFSASFRLSLVNGKNQSMGPLPEGIHLVSLDELIKKDSRFASQWANRRPITLENTLYRMGAQLTQAILVLVVDEGVQLTEPGIISFANSIQLAHSFLPINFLIYLKNKAKITLIQQIKEEGNLPSFTNFIQEIFVEEGAQLELYKIQDQSDWAHLVDHTFVYQGHETQATTHTFTLNGGYTRNNLHFYINGESSVANLNGLYIPNGKQLVDNHTVVDHTIPHSESNELYKGILCEQSTGVFNGKIFVRKDAQKTNAFQSCRNILASEHATMNTKPQLEIWADDVKCSHGTTTGQLSETALFYLRSRGIGENAARTLLMLAFGQEVIDQVGHEGLKGYLTEFVENKLRNSLTI